MSTIYCHRCDARYNPKAEWVYVFRGKNDTSGRANVLGPVRLKPGDCPMCLAPPQLKPDAVAGAM